MNLEEEQNRIKDEEIRKLTEECLCKAPPHFSYKPASSTGKYHAPDENESQGLILHTKRVCRVGEILIEAWIAPINADVIRSALILHDVRKYGKIYEPTRYTLSNHPKLGGEFVREVAGDRYPEDKVNAISNAILFHMGKWGVFPFEMKDENLIVHLADVLATKIYEDMK